MSKAESPKITVRRATLLDVPALLGPMLSFLKEAEHESPTEEDEKYLVLELMGAVQPTSQFVILIAEQHKGKRRDFAGYAVFDLRLDIFGRVMAWGHQLYVAPAFRGRDVAENLIKFGEEMVFSAGVKRIFLDTEHPDFFERGFGYKPKYTVLEKVKEEK